MNNQEEKDDSLAPIPYTLSGGARYGKTEEEEGIGRNEDIWYNMHNIIYTSQDPNVKEAVEDAREAAGKAEGASYKFKTQGLDGFKESTINKKKQGSDSESDTESKKLPLRKRGKFKGFGK